MQFCRLFKFFLFLLVEFFCRKTAVYEWNLYLYWRKSRICSVLAVKYSSELDIVLLACYYICTLTDITFT